MRPIFLPVFAFLTACATITPAPPSGEARYMEYPETLVTAFRMACSGQAESFVDRGNGVIECRQFMPPEPTAAAILYFDGTQNDLPQLVLQLQTLADSGGFVVSNAVFLRVPQRSGQILQVPMPDAEIDRAFDSIYERTGGTVE